MEKAIDINERKSAKEELPKEKEKVLKKSYQKKNKSYSYTHTKINKYEVIKSEIVTRPKLILKGDYEHWEISQKSHVTFAKKNPED